MSRHNRERREIKRKLKQDPKHKLTAYEFVRIHRHGKKRLAGRIFQVNFS